MNTSILVMEDDVNIQELIVEFLKAEGYDVDYASDGIEGIQLFKNNDLLNLWENLSNGKNDSFDLKCLYINDKIVNEVTFIRAYKNTDTLVDKRFKRTFSLYR